MGIFELVCPSCGEINSVDATACACGHIFNAVTGSYEAAQLTLQEEEAYLEYIKARLGQLKSEKEFAKSDVTANPGNRDKEHALELIRQEIADLKAQYDQQKAKIKVTQKVNDDLRGQMEKEAAEARARAEAEARRLEKEKQKAEALKKARQEAEAERARKKAETEAQARQAAEQKKKSELAKKQAEEAARRRATIEKQAEEAAKAEAVRRKQQALARQKQQEAAEMLAEAERIKRRAAEAAAAAERIAQKAARSKTKKDSVPMPGVFAKAAQMAKIARPEPELDAGSDLAGAADDIPQPETLECPICTADLPLGSTQCRCGYKFEAASSDMPALSTGDFFAPVASGEDQEMQQCPICTAEVPVNAKTCNCGYQFPSGETSMPGLSLDGGRDD